MQYMPNQPSMVSKTQYQNSIPNKAFVPPAQNGQAYDELKKRLLNEYKKLCTSKKNYDEQVRDRYKNLKQRSNSGKKSANTSITQPPAPNSQIPSQT